MSWLWNLWLRLCDWNCRRKYINEQQMMHDKRTILAIEKQGNIFTLLREFLEAYEARTDAIENGGESPKLDGIIEMLRSVAGMPAELALVKDELSLVHGLVADLIGKLDTQAATQARIDEYVKDLNKSTDNVEKAIKETKGE